MVLVLRSMTMTMATALTMALLVVVVRTMMMTLNPHLDKELDGKVCEADHAHGTGHRHHLKDL